MYILNLVELWYLRVRSYIKGDLDLPLKFGKLKFHSVIVHVPGKQSPRQSLHIKALSWMRVGCNQRNRHEGKRKESKYRRVSY